MKRFDTKALLLTLAVSALLWAVSAAICACVGSSPNVIPTRLQFETRLTDYVLPASLIGGALSAAGVTYQAILRNPLADPYLLGASGGAMLGAYAWHLPAMGFLISIGVGSPHATAFIGALLATGVVLSVSGARGRLDPVTAILVGVVINSLCGAAFVLLDSIYKSLPGMGGMMTFLVGDVQSNVSAADLTVSAIVIGVAWVMTLLSTQKLNIVRLSEEEALSLGANVFRVRLFGLLLASGMTAAAVAVSGPIGFIGLICPHIARRIVGNDNRRLFPVATAAGAALLSSADALSRVLQSVDRLGTIIPVGVITAIVGTPAFLFILLRMKRGAAT